ncbi:ParB N-terminal domain-containing protein [Caballeronia sp. GAFFF1]|uniref:ParB N-terminal domain-containing protein n=1 Tax=Caballeronia sp. GAFFF1 TaxID=2921779 RepID=UPI0020276FA7|nr:ParB N-terminal domain-containing protein [Caballeronia sp. GAFFF1]
MLKPLPDKARKSHEWTETDIENSQIQWKKGSCTDLVVPLRKVLVCPKVFQVRDLHTKSKAGITNGDHVTKLVERLDKETDLDPILVLPISANRFVVVDGTHRRAAYAQRDRQTIPVRIFTGTLSEARIAAGRSENAKRKLEWTHQEKSQYLYQLILERPRHPNGKPWTHKECAEAADRSERMARHMERFIRRCKDEGKPIPEKWTGGAWSSDEDETESAEERLARQFAEKLRAALGPLTSPGKARALGIALGQYTERADQVALALVEAGGLRDVIVEGVDEMIAEQAEEHAEAMQAQAATRQYLSGLSAAVGAGF